MTTDAPLDTDLEDRCSLASIAYLERNDFTQIQQVSRRVLKARDGGRHVYIWLVPPLAERTAASVAIPVELFHLADHDHARVDVISISVFGRDAQLKHMMNAQLL